MRTRVRAFGGLLRRAWLEYERDYARYFAVAMVYYALVSLIPFLLLLLGVIGLLLRFSDAAAALEQQVLSGVENNVGLPVRTVLDQALDLVQEQSTVATVVSLIGLLVTASKLFVHLRMTFRAIWKYAPPLTSGGLVGAIRESFKEKAFSYAIVLMTGVLMLASLTALAAVQWMTGLLADAPLFDSAANVLLALLSPVVVIGVMFALLFLVLPPVRLHWRHIWLATTLSTIAWLIGAEILVLFGGYVGSSGNMSGAAGGVIAMMLWINVLAQVLFYGAELCKVVYNQEAPATPFRESL